MCKTPHNDTRPDQFEPLPNQVRSTRIIADSQIEERKAVSKTLVIEQGMYRCMHGSTFVLLLVLSTEGSVKNTWFYLSLSFQTDTRTKTNRERKKEVETVKSWENQKAE